MGEEAEHQLHRSGNVHLLEDAGNPGIAPGIDKPRVVQAAEDDGDAGKKFLSVAEQEDEGVVVGTEEDVRSLVRVLGPEILPEGPYRPDR